jgi:NSS family neurotransmitter:Na+ symporter
LIGWVLGADTLRRFVNEHSKFTLGPWFNTWIKFVIPVVLGSVLLGTLWQDLSGGLYGSSYEMHGWQWLTFSIPLFWIVATLIMAALLTRRPAAPSVVRHNTPPGA